MATKYQHDLTLCRKTTGISRGRVCQNHEGRCVLCDSFVDMRVQARICDECGLGPSQGRCIVCNAPGAADAFYCKICQINEKDRDGCPRIVNVGIAKMDNYYKNQ